MAGNIARLGSGISGSVVLIPEDPQHDDAAGQPSQLLSPVAIALVGDARTVVTAHRGSPGNLQVTAWALDETGNLSLTSQLTGDPATAISLCAVSPRGGTTPRGFRRVVSAVRNGPGNLELVVWDVDSRGQLTRRGTGHAGEVTAVALCALSPSRVVAVMRNGSSNLELISWDIDGDGNLRRRGTGEAGGVWAVGVTAVTENRLVAVMKNLSLNLELITWDVDDKGAFTRRGEGDAGTVDAVSIASLGALGTLFPNANRVIAAMRNGSHDLELIAWDIDGDGHMRRRGTGLAGVGDVFTQEASNIAVTANPESGRILSAAKNRMGDLEITSWFTNEDGGVFRESTVSAEAISAVAMSIDEPHANFATAICNAQGQLECTAWTVGP